MISAVINTASLGPKAHESLGSRGNPHAQRAAYMRDVILPRAVAIFDDVIVAGEYERGGGYRYVCSPSRFFDSRDVIAQRQLGFEAAKHDLILFQMDDHVVSESFVEGLSRIKERWDVLSPARVSLSDGQLLNCGWNEVREEYRKSPYLHTHVIVMTRQAVLQCPWSGLPAIHRFEVMHSRRFQDALLKIRIAPKLTVFDLEA